MAGAVSGSLRSLRLPDRPGLPNEVEIFALRYHQPLQQIQSCDTKVKFEASQIATAFFKDRMTSRSAGLYDDGERPLGSSSAQNCHRQHVWLDLTSDPQRSASLMAACLALGITGDSHHALGSPTAPPRRCTRTALRGTRLGAPPRRPARRPAPGLQARAGLSLSNVAAAATVTIPVNVSVAAVATVPTEAANSYFRDQGSPLWKQDEPPSTAR